MLPDLYIFAATFITLLVLIGITFFIVRNHKRKEGNAQSLDRQLMERLVREQERGKRMSDRIEALEQEVALIHHELKQMSHPHINNNHQQTDGSCFQNSLHMQTFLQKHHDLVLLLREGHSVDATAKMTSRSRREVEMVDSVLKDKKCKD